MTHSSSEAEFKAHLQKLDDAGGRINTALSAANETMHPEAFGLLGIPLAAICSGAQALAASAISSASDAAVDHYKRFADMSLHIKSNEEAQAATLDGMHNK